MMAEQRMEEERTAGGTKISEEKKSGRVRKTAKVDEQNDECTRRNKNVCKT